MAMMSAAFAGEPARQVIVSAGKHDRKNTIVKISAPAPLTAVWQLRDDAGKVSPVQSDGQKDTWFILSELKAGQSKSFVLERADTDPSYKAPAGVSAERQGNVVNISIDGKAVISYQGDKTKLPDGYEPQFQRGGYIYPVFTPGGKLVTDDYPPNHKHHHSIWWAWTKTEFEGRKPDFWNMGSKGATVEFTALDAAVSEPVFLPPSTVTSAAWRSI